MGHPEIACLPDRLVPLNAIDGKTKIIGSFELMIYNETRNYRCHSFIPAVCHLEDLVEGQTPPYDVGFAQSLPFFFGMVLIGYALARVWVWNNMSISRVISKTVWR